MRKKKFRAALIQMEFTVLSQYCSIRSEKQRGVFWFSSFLIFCNASAKKIYLIFSRHIRKKEFCFPTMLPGKPPKLCTDIIHSFRKLYIISSLLYCCLQKSFRISFIFLPTTLRIHLYQCGTKFRRVIRRSYCRRRLVLTDFPSAMT